MTTQFFIPMRPPTTTHNAKELHAYMKGGKPCAVLHDITHETGTVHTGTRVIATCTVRSTHKLKGVVHEILAGIGCCFCCLGCCCLCCCQFFFQLLCCLNFRSRPIVLIGIFFRRNFKYSRNRSFLDDLRLCVCNHRFLPHQTA